MMTPLLLCLSLATIPAEGDTITLHIPIIDDSPNQHRFYHELLYQALTQTGHTPDFISPTLPQLRVKSYLASGRISIYWMLETNERSRKYKLIDIGLTNGLVGKRILFIRAEDQPLYSAVNNLDDFRNLNFVAAIGKGWFDRQVWSLNELPYKIKHGNWKTVFKMIPKHRSFDYVSRGVNEIHVEAKEHPHLSIEEKLVLIFERDFKFYLSNTGDHPGLPYSDIINTAMNQAKDSGLIDKLVKKYWRDAFEMLNYKQRTKIKLQTPGQLSKQ